MNKKNILIIFVSGLLILIGFYIFNLFSGPTDGPVQVASVEYNDSSNYEIPKGAKEIMYDSEFGKAYLLEKNEKTFIYVSYVYGTATNEPQFLSYEEIEGELVINVSQEIKEKGAIGLTVMSYHSYKIEINDTFDKVVIKEVKGTIK
jgi:hypothetical protein